MCHKNEDPTLKGTFLKGLAYLSKNTVFVEYGAVL